MVANSPADESKPSLTAAPDDSVYLAWQSEEDGQTTVHVARRLASGSWSSEYQTSAEADQFLPALASDGQSTVYLHGHDGSAGSLLLPFKQAACPWSALGVQYGWLE